MQLLIDGDYIIYAAGFAGQKTVYLYHEGHQDIFLDTSMTDLRKQLAERGVDYDSRRLYTQIRLDPIEHVLHSAKRMIEGIVTRVGDRFPLSDTRLFVDGDGNFRSRLATIRPYKGQRAPDSKPRYYNEIRRYLIDSHRAEVVFDQETDDALSIEAHALPPGKTIIAAVDKDLLQVRGWHFNPMEGKGFKKVGTREARRRLYTQCLAGDSVDNIAGCYKIGKVGAEKILADKLDDEVAMWEAVVDAYRSSIRIYGEQTGYGHLTGNQAAIENMRLVYLRRAEGQLWHPPVRD